MYGPPYLSHGFPTRISTRDSLNGPADQIALKRTSFEPILTHQIGTLIGTTVSVYFCMVSVDEGLISRLLARHKYSLHRDAFYKSPVQPSEMVFRS